MKKIITLAVALVAAVFGANAQMYVMGAGIQGSSWNYAGAGLEMTATDTGYEGTFTVVETGTGVGHFALITKNNCASWNELNGSYRLQPKGGEGPVNKPGEAVAYENGQGAFQAPLGTFKFVVNTTDQTLTIIGDAEPIPEPDPVEEDGVYLIGEVNGNEWGYNIGVALTEIGSGIYSGDVTFNDGAYFAVATTLSASSWDQLNANYRYGPQTDGDAVTFGQAMTMYKGGNAWRVTTGGTYTVTVDINNGMILVAEKGTTPTPDFMGSSLYLGYYKNDELNMVYTIELHETEDNVFTGQLVPNDLVSTVLPLIFDFTNSISLDELCVEVSATVSDIFGNISSHKWNGVGDAPAITVGANPMQEDGSPWSLTQLIQMFSGNTDAINDPIDITADFNRKVLILGSEVLKGDINGDGSIDGNDVSILLEMVLAGGVTAEQTAVADINGDTSVDGNDVSILLEMVLAGE